MAKMIEITINEDGTVEMDQKGWSGKSCSIDVKGLIDRLGKEVSNTRKPEYYKEEKVKINQHNIG